MALRLVAIGLAIAIAACGGDGMPCEMPTCNPTGELRVGVFLIEFPGSPFPTQFLTFAEVRDLFFSQTRMSLAGYIREASYGRSWVTGEAFGPVPLARYYDPDSNADRLGALQAVIDATASAIDFSRYNRLVLVWPATPGHDIPGHGSIGCLSPFSSPNLPGIGKFAGSGFWLIIARRVSYESMLGTIIHEFGHNLGLNHADSLSFAPAALGAPGSPGTRKGYGDVNSTMGMSDFLGHRAAPHKHKLGWLEPETSLRAVESGSTLRLLPYESAAPGLKALRVRRAPGSDKWLWLEYRQPAGYDIRLGNPGGQIFTGALVHYEDREAVNEWDTTMLLDFGAAQTSNDFQDAALASGQSWSDAWGPLTIRAGKADASGLDVTVAYDAPCHTLGSAGRLHGRGSETGDITVSAPAGCNWTATSSTEWLIVTSGRSGNGAGTVGYVVGPNKTGHMRSSVIAVGRQLFAVTQWGGAANRPYISWQTVMHGATLLLEDGLAPSSWFTIQGRNLSPVTRIWKQSDFAGNKLPTKLDGVRVNVKGVAASLYYVSPTQINALMPDDPVDEAVPRVTDIQVVTAEGASDVVPAWVRPYTPARCSASSRRAASTPPLRTPMASC